MQATYSPEDNKLRLYSSTRLDKEAYQRVKDAGFRWAPKQDLFVAPMWTPEREDLLIELCGEVGDEDTSLVERQEQRAERFSDYQENRASDAERAHKTVEQISERFAGGQPILCGHHSEKRARKDAERIENGMRKALRMWETSEYWRDRAAGAIRHAKYKELPAVRARRIKGLEADIRQYRARFTPAEPKQVIMQQGWDAPADAPKVPHVWCAPRGGRGGSWVPVDRLPGIEAHYSRWIQHCELRLEYERAMLADSGGTVADKTGPEVGGACQCWASPRGGWSYIVKVNQVSVTILDKPPYGEKVYKQTMAFDKLHAVMTRAQVEEKRAAGLLHETQYKDGFFLLDAPLPPKPKEPKPEPEAAKFQALRETLKAGVQVVSAPQLFPTPPDLAARMVELAEIQPGQSVLEPSAGTGNILQAIKRAHHGTITLTAVEINPRLASVLNTVINAADHVRCADFLECNGDLGQYDRILMNPPFENGADLAHIRHALTMLKPGGRLVAICADGPRQNAVLRKLAEDSGEWEPLPEGTFKSSGTGVRTVLLTINQAPEIPEIQTLAGESLSLFPEGL